MFEVIAMIGVWSNCLIRWQAETPSRLGMMMSINIRSYFDPAFILLTASKPSSYARIRIRYILASDGKSYRAVNGTIEGVEEFAAYPSTCRIIFNQ